MLRRPEPGQHGTLKNKYGSAHVEVIGFEFERSHWITVRLLSPFREHAAGAEVVFMQCDEFEVDADAKS